MAYLSTKQAAEILGVDPSTMRLWRMNGSGPPYINLGEASYRYDGDELRRWVDARRVQPVRAITEKDYAAV